VRATQSALLPPLSWVGQRVLGPRADDVVRGVGWSGFFTVTALMAIPGLLLAWRVARDVKSD
jgi:PAT family beta-lactamase induction signal transducer AmpG